MKIKVGSAEGIKCCLIYCGDGQYRLREYRDNDEFTDYDIRHSDLFVTIDDETASIYLDDVTGQMSIDYNPEILELEDDQETCPRCGDDWSGTSCGIPNCGWVTGVDDE